MKNESAFADLHARFLSTSTQAPIGPGWLKTTTAIAKDVVGRALRQLRAEGLPVGVYVMLSEPVAAEEDEGWERALRLVQLRYVCALGRTRIYASYPRNALRNALLSPAWNYPADGSYPERQTYSIEELGMFRSVEFVEPVGLFHGFHRRRAETNG